MVSTQYPQRRWLKLAAIGVVVVSGWLLLGCDGSTAATAPMAKEDAAAVASGPDAEQLAALGIEFGTVEAATSMSIDGLPAEIAEPLDASARVAAPFAGVVTRVLVDDGEDVVVGQPLVRIQSRELLAAVAAATSAESEALLAKQSARRDAQLFAEGIIPASRNEATAARAAIAEAAHKQADGALSGLRPVNTGAPGEHELLSPMAGRVLHRSVTPGQSLAALDETFSIAAPGRLDLTLNVPISLRPQLRPGLKVLLPDGHAATVLSIGGNTDRVSQNLRLRARIEDNAAWVPGQHLQATLQLPVPPNSVKVPALALLPRGDRLVVVVKEQERYRTVDVVRLGTDGEFAVVRGELDPGTQIVARGASALKATLADAQ